MATGETKPHPPQSPAAGAGGEPQVASMSSSQHEHIGHTTSQPINATMLLGMASSQEAEGQDLAPGIYAIQSNTFLGAITGYPHSMLVPLTYKIPTGDISGAVAGPDQQGQGGRQANGVQRRHVVVRRLQFEFQLDMALILKLAAIVYLFSQDGSYQRMIFLIICSVIIYLHQTGVLLPFLRYLQRAAAARPPQPPGAADNNPPAANNIIRNNPQPDNVAAEEADPAAPQGAAGNQGPNQNDNQGVQNNQPPVENQRGNQGHWMGFMRELQTFVFGFVASLFPGFQHND